MFLNPENYQEPLKWPEKVPKTTPDTPPKPQKEDPKIGAEIRHILGQFLTLSGPQNSRQKCSEKGAKIDHFFLLFFYKKIS